mgnify:CR=1 FL=1
MIPEIGGVPYITVGHSMVHVCYLRYPVIAVTWINPIKARAPNNSKMCPSVSLVYPDHICLGVGPDFAEMCINGSVRIIRTVQIPPVD